MAYLISIVEYLEHCLVALASSTISNAETEYWMQNYYFKLYSCALKAISYL